MIRVALPTHLRALARIDDEITVNVGGPVTVASVLDAVETAHPQLRGTIRDHATKKRRAFVRYVACGEDVSLEPTDVPLPEAIATGAEPLRIIGAMAGG